MDDLLIEENAFYDAQDVCQQHDDEFVDADITQYADHGIDLMAGSRYFVRNYSGRNSFVNNVLKQRLNQYNRLTQSQARAAMNVMKEELTGKRVRKSNLRCFTCDAGPFDSWD